jgi:hypothetical protein
MIYGIQSRFSCFSDSFFASREKMVELFAGINPEKVENNPDIEKQWAVKAMEHAETYSRLIHKVQGSCLRLTP